MVGAVFPCYESEFYENIYQFMGIKELWQAAYTPHNIKHLNYLCSDEWGSMVSTRRVEKFADFKDEGAAFGIGRMARAQWGLNCRRAGVRLTPPFKPKLDAAAFGRRMPGPV